MSLREVLEQCIDKLGKVRPSVDEFQEVAIPVREVQDTLKAVVHGLWEPGDPIETAPPDLQEKLLQSQKQQFDEEIKMEGNKP